MSPNKDRILVRNMELDVTRPEVTLWSDSGSRLLAHDLWSMNTDLFICVCLSALGYGLLRVRPWVSPRVTTSIGASYEKNL